MRVYRVVITTHGGVRLTAQEVADLIGDAFEDTGFDEDSGLPRGSLLRIDVTTTTTEGRGRAANG
jgi:hypothetical protein